MATVGLREFLSIDDLDVCPHALVTDTAILVTRHQMVFRFFESRAHFRDESRHHHAVHIRVRMRNPCTTSGLVTLENDRRVAGTTMQEGTKEYCCAMTRTITEPSG